MALATRGPPPTAPKAIPPNQTLYVHNLPDAPRNRDLKRSLYMLFATYGVVLDVITIKNKKMRGQAHVVFRDIDSSTQAMRALQGFNFFGKDMKIEYAKSKSHTFAKLEGTYFKQPDRSMQAEQTAPTTAQQAVFGIGAAPTKAKPIQPQTQEEGAKGVKRGREEESEEEEEGEEDDAAMDVSDSE
ncbi:RNA-binding domain-containing protein [Lojkania enalia]|uniref:RNA-binding domain-containing protein n=1 Tax=Lojkania enalia TaxID=147567 RepID=A0A9P4KCB5_9PLEO|nr:RNA-binding domain-containing protein [Didymosphaeria enalia]